MEGRVAREACTRLLEHIGTKRRTVCGIGSTKELRGRGWMSLLLSFGFLLREGDVEIVDGGYYAAL